MSNTPLYYLPHEGVKAVWNPEETDLTLTLPWVTIDLAIDANKKQLVKEALDNLYKFSMHPSVQWFLKSLELYTVAYYGPKSLTSFQRPHTLNKLPIEQGALKSPRSFTKQIVPNITAEL